MLKNKMMNMKVALFISFFLLFQCMGFTGNAYSDQSQENKQQIPLRYEVTVAVKLIPVFVTDKDGNSIMDLAKSDFELTDNGEVKKITEFEKHFLPKRAGEESHARNETLKAESKLSRKFFFLFDIARNDQAGIIRSKKTALHFINTWLLPSDEIAVLSYSPLRGLIVHKGLSRDQGEVKKAINRISETPGNVSEGMAMNGFVSQEGNQPEIPFSEPYSPEGEYQKMKARQFATDLKELAMSLRSVEGYKNIILFSSGISRSLLNDAEDSGVRDNLGDASKEAASSGIPVYSVNSGTTQISIRGESSRGDDSLKLLSDVSGGRYFSNISDYEIISEEIQNSTNNYYVLGFYINDKWDGKYHELKVMVKKKGLTVRAQSGYFNSKPFAEFSAFEKQLQLIDLILGENSQFQFPSSLPVSCSQFYDNETANYVLLAKIPTEKIEEVIKQRTEIIDVILDENNNLVDIKRGEVNFPSLGKKKICHYSIGSLSPGNYKCKVIIRNLETGLAAVGSSSVIISKNPDFLLHLSSPLLLLSDEPAFYLKLSGAQTNKISLSNVYPFNPKEYSPLTGEMAQGIKVIYTAIRYSVGNMVNPIVELSANLASKATDKEIPLPLSILLKTKTANIETLLLKLELPKLEPDEYVLNLYVQESSTKTTCSSRVSFRIY